MQKKIFYFLLAALTAVLLLPTAVLADGDVAQVDGSDYATLADAIANAEDGDTITLLADIADVGEISLPAGVTLNGDGHKLSGDTSVYINKNGGTVTNVVFENIGNGGTLTAIHGSGLSGKATITGCTFDNIEYEAIQITPVAEADIEITGNIFRHTANGTAKRYVHVESAKNVDFAATVTGNKFYDCAKLEETGLEVYYPSDPAKLDCSRNYMDAPIGVCIGTGNSYYNATAKAFPFVEEDMETEVQSNAAVQVYSGSYNTYIYPTFAEAFTAATTITSFGNTLLLFSDVTVTDTLVVSGASTINIDLNGHNITANGVRAIHLKDGTLKLTGSGTISSNVANVASSVIRVGDNSATRFATLTVDTDVIVSTATAYGITAFGAQNEKVIVYGTVKSTAPANGAYDGSAIATNGNDTTPATITVKNTARISAANTNAIYLPSGILDVNADIGGNSAVITGTTGIYVKGGTATINGGTITGNGEKKDYQYYGNGGISTGDALVIDNCGYPTDISSVAIKGGTFVSENGVQVGAYYGNTKTAIATVTSTDTTLTAPDGYMWANGTLAKAVALVDGTKYATLAEAFAAAEAGDTITLLADTELAEDLIIDKNVTLDLAGKTVECGTYFIEVTGDVTITGNGTINKEEANITEDLTYPGISYHKTTSFRGVIYVGEGAKLTVKNGTYTTKTSSLFVCDNGILTLEDGLFKCTSTDPYDTKGLIDVRGENGVLNLLSGSVECYENWDDYEGMYGVSAWDGGTLNFGQVGTDGPTVHSYYAAIATNGTTPPVFINIYSGTFISDCDTGESGAEGDMNVILISAEAENGSKLNIYGGTFTQTATNFKTSHVIAVRWKAEKSVQIFGGQFSCADSVIYSGEGNKNSAISITGGLYTSDVADFCAEGYTTKKDGDLWIVCKKPVAKINDVEFTSLADAIDAVGDGETIIMIADVVGACGISVPSGKNFTVDFAGHTYSVEKPGAGSTYTKTQAFQLLENSTIVFKNGTISCTEANKTAVKEGDIKPVKMMIQNYANLTLDNMTIDGTNINREGDTVRYIVSNNSGTVAIKDTKIITVENDIAFDTCKYGKYAVPTVTVSGNSVIGTIELGGGNLTLTAGTIGGLKVDNIGDGIITKTNDVTVAAPDGYVWSKAGKLSVPVAKIGDVKYATLADAIDAAEADDTIELLANCSGDGITIKKSITVDFGGFTYTVCGPTLAGSTGTKTQGFQLLKDNTIVFKNGTIKTTAEANAKMLIQNYSDLTLDDMTLDGSNLIGTKYTLSNNNGDIVLSGATTIIAAEGGVAYDLYDWSQYYTGITLKIEGDDVVINGKAEVDGDNDVLHIKVTAPAKLMPPAPEGYAWTKDGTLVKATAVAQIGDAKYATLADAIAVVGDGETITMIADVAAANGISVPSGKNFTVDFAGHTYSVEKPGAGSANTKTQAFQLLENSTIVFKNGTISCTEANKTAVTVGDIKPVKMMIQNYANLTLDNMTIDGTNINHADNDMVRYIVSNNSGTVVIKDTTITTVGDDIAFDTCKYGKYAVPTVTVSGTSNVGTIELSGGNLTLTAGIIRGLKDSGIGDGVIVITGGKYTNTDRVSDFVAAGYELSGDTVKSKVVADGDVEVQISSETKQEDATIDPGIQGEDATAAEAITGAIDGKDVVDLSGVIDTYLNGLDFEKMQEIAKNNDKDGDLEGLFQAAQDAAGEGKTVEVSMKIETNISVAVTGVKQTAGSINGFTLDITPTYSLVVVSTVDGVETEKVTVIDKDELEPDETVTVSFPAPAGFVYKSGDVVLVIHTKEDGTKYVYDATYSDGMISFENPHGFSGFELLTVNPNAVACNATSGETYEKLDAALTAANAGETVVLLKDLVEADKVVYLVVKPGVTLDVAGYTVESDYAVVFGMVKDSMGDGKLKIADAKNLVYNIEQVEVSCANDDYKDVRILPAWDTDGYVFRSVTGFGTNWAESDRYTISLSSKELDDIFADDTGIELYVRLNYTNSEGETVKSEYRIGRSFVAEYMAMVAATGGEKGVISVTFTGTNGITIVSACTFYKAEQCNFTLGGVTKSAN